MNNNICFDISSVTLTGSGKKLTPDKEGIYHEVPMMVLGKPSNNRKIYDVESVLLQFNHPQSVFRRKLISGQLQGEWGHPIILKKEDLPRVGVVDPKNVSHLILNLKTSAPTEKGHVIVYGKVLPMGEKKNSLIESFESTYSNTAFSLRSAVRDQRRQGMYLHQKVSALVTFDGVDCPGYPEASKIRVPEFEGAQYFIDPLTCKSMVEDVFGFENVNDQQLLDLLETNKITIGKTISGYVSTEAQAIVGDDGSMHDIFHSVMENKLK